MIEGFLPPNTFTYRPWESLLYIGNKESAYPFYPNQNLKMKSVGDLCHHTEYEIQKNENWITDKLGYRNNYFIENPDILIIGDSFITGSSIDQDSTLIESLKNKLKCKVYNIAPASFNDFIFLLNNDIIKKPKTIIYSIIERNIPQPIFLKNNKGTLSKQNNLWIYKDKCTRMYSYNYFKSRILKTKGNGVPVIKDKTMYFYSGVNQYYPYERLNEAMENVVSYKTFCDSIGVKFIFIPLPNKETVYYENVPFLKFNQIIYRNLMLFYPKKKLQQLIL